MDKTSRALLGVEDNAESIRTLYSMLGKIDRVSYTLLTGKPEGGAMSFGTVKADGCCVIVAFDGESCSVFFDGIEAGTGTSPILAVLPAKTGVLTLSGIRNNARALLIGNASAVT